VKPSHHDQTFYDGLRKLIDTPITQAEVVQFKCQLAAKRAQEDLERQQAQQLPLLVVA
jgi:hypothetical protein